MKVYVKKDVCGWKHQNIEIRKHLYRKTGDDGINDMYTRCSEGVIYACIIVTYHLASLSLIYTDEIYIAKH